MLSKQTIEHFEDLLCEKVIKIRTLSGGDINEVYLLITQVRKLVVKLNRVSMFLGMFEAEAKGLEELRKANIFTIPKVLHYGKYSDDAFLLLEYIRSGNQVEDFWSLFGEQLAILHQNSRPYFGFESDNYIGSLPQYNTESHSAVDFYIAQRLSPQFILAEKKGFSFHNLDSFYKSIESEIPNEASSLIHGDLWNGNFMIDHNGFPCLIDPAIAFAPREMDITMMHLFGGFNQELFEVYQDIFPLVENWEERIAIWQLYYLLVHLNLFGSSYLKQVHSIIKRYS
ncbi:fructosamine kinase [Aquimarina sp. BL5]|uniref:fructosamine kinase family protein n=1 Tax=Aquimarina sp. BL5 TaxID=1714860 RepID=UPI000E52321C|nr:fructosamine kinase family protein [Aquimarina sp. BL5]AXT51263.1 fructosamine kinase [Aquimarina sp. BL5]RKN09474.1 fructosamine kinase [Aquimarina sp. BL5]